MFWTLKWPLSGESFTPIHCLASMMVLLSPSPNWRCDIQHPGNTLISYTSNNPNYPFNVKTAGWVFLSWINLYFLYLIFSPFKILNGQETEGMMKRSTIDSTLTVVQSISIWVKGLCLTLWLSWLMLCLTSSVSCSRVEISCAESGEIRVRKH